MKVQSIKVLMAAKVHGTLEVCSSYEAREVFMGHYPMLGYAFRIWLTTYYC